MIQYVFMLDLCYACMLKYQKKKNFSVNNFCNNQIDINEEKLIYLAELKHHSSTISDCKLNFDGTLYSTLDIQNQVKSIK